MSYPIYTNTNESVTPALKSSLPQRTNLALTVVRMKNRMWVQEGGSFRRKEKKPFLADQLREDVLLLVVVHRRQTF